MLCEPHVQEQNSRGAEKGPVFRWIISARASETLRGGGQSECGIGVPFPAFQNECGLFIRFLFYKHLQGRKVVRETSW